MSAQRPSYSDKKRKYTAPKPIAPSLDADALMSIAQVAAHFGRKSKMCVERWLRRDGFDFPRPRMIAGQRYWRRGDILAFVERQARSHNTPSHDSSAKPAISARATQSLADGDTLVKRSQPFGG
jgi:predicted DNA-binding transcriptional regulator AlpA